MEITAENLTHSLIREIAKRADSKLTISPEWKEQTEAQNARAKAKPWNNHPPRNTSDFWWEYLCLHAGFMWAWGAYETKEELIGAFWPYQESPDVIDEIIDNP